MIDYVGHIDVAPALNGAEIDYLQSGSLLDESGGLALGRCPWLPSADGRRVTCMADDDKAAEWLRYLIGELLKPGANRSFRKELKGFSFDHYLDGMVVGSRPSGELFAITASHNRVRQRVLRPAPCADESAPPVRRLDESPGAKVIPLRRYR